MKGKKKPSKTPMTDALISATAKLDAERAAAAEKKAKMAKTLRDLLDAARKVEKAREALMFAEAELLGLAGHDVALPATYTISWRHVDGSSVVVKETP